jgi:hypothetical protein
LIEIGTLDVSLIARECDRRNDRHDGDGNHQFDQCEPAMAYNVQDGDPLLQPTLS